MHKMNVKTKYYNLLESGEKTIELRLFDEKRQKIKIGDKIIFSDSSDNTRTFNAVVVNFGHIGIECAERLIKHIKRRHH